MNVTERNVGKFNRQIQDVANDVNNMVNLPKKDPKEVRVIEKVPHKRLYHLKK